MGENKKDIIKSVNRAFDIVEIVIKQKAPIGVTRISELDNLHKSTVFRISNTLCYLGYISQNENNKYTVGLKLFEMGSLAIHDLDLRQSVSPYLKVLQSITGETIHLGILNNMEGKMEIK